MKQRRTRKNNLDIIGTIGQQKNVMIRNCPVLIPKENMKMFSTMSKAVNAHPYKTFGNSF